MAELTKEYLDQAFEKQAILINRAFQAQTDQINKLDARIAKLESEISALSTKINNFLQLSDKRYLELKHRDTVMAKWVKKIADKTGVEIDLEELEKF